MKDLKRIRELKYFSLAATAMSLLMVGYALADMAVVANNGDPVPDGMNFIDFMFRGIAGFWLCAFVLLQVWEWIIRLRK